MYVKIPRKTYKNPKKRKKTYKKVGITDTYLIFCFKSYLGSASSYIRFKAWHHPYMKRIEQYMQSVLF